MKRFLTILLSVMLLCCSSFILTACGDEGGETPPAHTHVFNKQVLSDEYKASDATCNSPAKYYYVCTCWEHGQETFNVGDPLGHDYLLYVSNGNDTHNKVCINDNTHIVIENCSGGDASLTGKAVCEKCNAEYGEEYIHVHEFNKQNINNKYKVTDATCTEKAIYYYSCACGEKGTLTFEGGPTPSHLYGDWVSSSNGTHVRRCKKNASHKEVENCSGGTFDENGLGNCTICGGEYLDPNYHAHVYNKKVIAEEYILIEATCQQKGKYYYSCSCKKAGNAAFDVDKVPCKYESGACIWCGTEEN